MKNIKEASELIKNSKKVMALTGAGISTESGIPDFRSNTGYYTKMDPLKALSREVLLHDPKRFYKEGYVILEDLQEKKPNEGHIALAKMEEKGFIKGIITQNIDNLHFIAGSKNIYEVHGESRTISCIKCHRTYPFSLMEEKVKKGEIPPLCKECKGVLRPNVVMFGDSMPDEFYKAVEEINDTDTLIIVGTSLQVAPVNMLPKYVKNLIIINNDKTTEDERAKFVFRESASKVLMAIYKELLNV